MIKTIITDLMVSKKPEVKVGASGKQYARILCSAYVGKDSNGNSEYLNVNVTVFGNAAQRSAELDKGNRINVFGNAKAGHYLRQDGTVVDTLDVTADTFERPLGSKTHEQAQGNASPAQRQSGYAKQATEPAPDEDLPF